MPFCIKIIILVLSAFLIGCEDSDKLWEDGDYRVYKRPRSREIIMGYHFGNGGVLGLSEPTVTSAGANPLYVVYVVNSSKYYYILKEDVGEGVTHGPYDKHEYKKLKTKKTLPSFQWHYKK